MDRGGRWRRGETAGSTTAVMDMYFWNVGGFPSLCISARRRYHSKCCCRECNSREGYETWVREDQQQGEGGVHRLGPIKKISLVSEFRLA